MKHEEIVDIVAKTLVKAGSTFTPDKIEAYNRIIANESNAHTKWVMEQILENAFVAEKNQSPLCDDTGIPHLYLEIGKGQTVSSEDIDAIYMGVKEGLRRLPGRPMAVLGDEEQRLDQSCGLDSDPANLEPAPIQIRKGNEEKTKLFILMEGGGPAIRGKDYRVFHKHSVNVVVEEIVSWATDAVSMIGCSPCTLAIGVGRSHYEAAAMMMEAQLHGNYNQQSRLEKEITDRVNEAGIGALGLGGDTSVIGTFLKVGPQRASGVRIVCLRPCCCFEPRIAWTEL